MRTSLHNALAALLLAAGAASAQVTKVPVLDPAVGSGSGASGASLNQAGSQNGAKLDVSAPTLTGQKLPAAISPSPIVGQSGRTQAGIAPVEQTKILPAVRAPGAVKSLKTRSAGVNESEKPDLTTPAVGSKEFQQGLRDVGEKTGEVRKGAGDEHPDSRGEKDAGLGAVLFDGGISHELSLDAPAVPVAEPDPEPARVDGLAKAAVRYIRNIAGGIKLKPSQVRGLYEGWLEEKRIDPGSKLGLALEAKLFPKRSAALQAELAKVSAPYRHFAHLMVTVSRSHGVAVEHTEALIAQRKVGSTLAGTRDKGTIERILNNILQRDYVDGVVKDYPHNRQGDFLRSLAQDILTKTGKSVEEIGRAGAFAYVDFMGNGVSKTRTGRDPDDQTAHVVFYCELQGGKWKIGGYRQNKRPGFPGGPDSAWVENLKKWLVQGGIPEDSFVPAAIH